MTYPNIYTRHFFIPIPNRVKMKSQDKLRIPRKKKSRIASNRTLQSSSSREVSTRVQFLRGLLFIVARKPLTPHFYVGVATPAVRFSAPRRIHLTHIAQVAVLAGRSSRSLDLNCDASRDASIACARARVRATHSQSTFIHQHRTCPPDTLGRCADL